MNTTEDYLFEKGLLDEEDDLLFEEDNLLDKEEDLFRKMLIDEADSEIQNGNYQKAESLYQCIGRPDLIAIMYINLNMLDKALEICLKYFGSPKIQNVINEYKLEYKLEKFSRNVKRSKFDIFMNETIKNLNLSK